MAVTSGNGNIAWLATTGFRQGLERDEYLATLARTRIAPCPSGPHSLDSFRFYEALACGALPIIDRYTPQGYEGEFWTALFGVMPDDMPGVPFMYDSWAALPRLVDRFGSSPAWEQKRDEVRAWWIRYQANLARDFADTITRLRES